MANSPIRNGFTIVELLIVIVIIAILAAITIVAYNGIQNRANDTTVKADLVNFAKKMELFKIDDTAGSYPSTGSLATAKGMNFSKGSYLTDTTNNNVIYCLAGDRSDWGLVARSKSGEAFYVSASKRSATSYTPAWTNGGSTTCNSVLTVGTGFSWAWGYSPSGWQWAN